MAYKINFKDATCKYVEEYSAGKYGTKVKIYFCEGDAVTPKGYSASVGAKTITAEDINDLKSKLDREMAKRDKEIEKSLKDADYTKQELLDAVMEAYGYNKKKATEYIKTLSEGAKKAIVEGFKGNAKKSFYNDKKFKDEDSYDVLIYKYKDENKEHRREYYDADELEEAYLDKKADKDIEYVYHQRISYYDDESEEVEEIKGYSAKDANFATLTPGTVKLKRDSKKFNQKDAKFCDESADDIIDLFEEAYNRGKSWAWLEKRLPSQFLNMRNKHNSEIFPIKQERNDRFRGVYLTKPKTLVEEVKASGSIDNFIESLKDYINLVNDLEDKYQLGIINYDNYSISKLIEEAKKNTDSRKLFTDLDIAKDSVNAYYNNLYNLARKIEGLDFWSDSVNNYAKKFKELGEQGLYNFIIDKIKKSYEAGRYKERQQKAVATTPEGRSIEYQRDLVGPLSEEAKAYIRRIYGGKTTEEIEAQRQERYNNKTERWLGWGKGYVTKNDILGDYTIEIDKLKDLLSELKSEARKETALGIEVSPKRRKTKWVGYNNGGYNYSGNFVGYGRNKGGYELTNEYYPNSVSLNMQGLGSLQEALNSVVGAKTLDDMQEGLANALEIIKTLPRSNPKVAEIRAKINELLDKRRNNNVVRRPLPDKKFRR